MEIEFSKIEGLGNDFIVIDCLKRNTQDLLNIIDQAALLCDRHFGIGADGLLLVLPSKVADYKMRIINADGSEPEMCGNGIRCFGEYIRIKYSLQNQLSVETLSGIIKLVFDNNLYTVNMGKPVFNNKEIPVIALEQEPLSINRTLTANDLNYQFTAVSMGNPHCVIFTENIEDIDLKIIGPLIENHELFPGKTNVEFIEVLSASEISFRVWERGCGETLACGTGACAAVAAGIINKILQNKVLVHLPGGDLSIKWDISDEKISSLLEDPAKEKLIIDQDIFMKGPARIVFSGSITL